ncbi:hypothetical protein Esti_004796 [Eimeria stiedai]
MVRGLVMLLLFQSLHDLTEQHADAHNVGGPALSGMAKSEGERDGLIVSLHSDALLLSPGEEFHVTAVVKRGLEKSLAHNGVWLGLQILRAQSPHGISDSTPNHAVTWKHGKDGRATWDVTIEDEGKFFASVFARIPCDTGGKQVHEAPCFLPLPLRQEGQVQLTVTYLSARLVVSWDQTQTVEALSDLTKTPQGMLKVFAVAFDGTTVERALKGPVQVVAVDATSDNYSNLQNVLGGTTTSSIENGVAEFPSLRFLLPGTYRLVALADGARAAKSEPIVVTSAAAGILRFCEQPPALVLFPPIAPMRVAVEIVTASGERKANFEGEVELQLQSNDFHQEPLQQRHKVKCHHGLCLWNRLMLTVAAGQYRLKAAVVQETAESHLPPQNAGLPTPAFSALIDFRKFEHETSEDKILEPGLRGDVQKDAEELCRFVRTAPSVVRVGQPWDAEVAINSAPLSVPEEVLLKESSSLNRPVTDYLPVDSWWSTWMQIRSAASLRREVNAFQRLRQRGRLLRRSKRMHVKHKIQISVAESSGDGIIALSGDVVGTTNEIGVAVIKGLTFWLKGDVTSWPQSLWVRLRAVCATCGVDKDRVRPAHTSSKVYIDASAPVGVYLNPAAALAAVSRWQHAKPLASIKSSLPVSLPGRPAQVCVQLLERPFADVLITAHPEDNLVRLGSASIRVSPYTWPQPACWHFKGVSEQLHEPTLGAYQKVKLQLRSADALYGTKGLLSWRGLAAPDGSVPIIVLPSRAIPRRSRLLHSLRWRSSRQLEVLRGQNVEKPIWLDLREGPLRGSARILLLPPEAKDEQGQGKHLVTSLQLQETNLPTTLFWRNAAVMADLVTPQTHIILEFTALGSVFTRVHVEGKCIDRDAGRAVMSTIEKHISIEKQGLPPLHSSEGHVRDQNQVWQQLELTLDWERLGSEGAGLLQHHVVCEFHATAEESMQPLRLLPKSSVDIIATRRQCEEGSIFLFKASKCVPCPEGFDCSHAVLRPCKEGESSPQGELLCRPSPIRKAVRRGEVGPDIRGCPSNLHLAVEYDKNSHCSVCPAGFSCQNDKKERCLSGTYAPIGSGKCLPCPENAMCADPAEAPKPCPFGWQRKGEATECTPCRPGTMCKSCGGSITGHMCEILCPQGTYTKPKYPGVCIPCPPGFQCPNPAESPQPCPSGTSSLGGQQRCSVAPEGLIVVQGKEHLPPRPCEAGLIPLEVDGTWFCGLDYSAADPVREELPEHIRSSLGDRAVFTASQPFPIGCEVDFMNHSWCFSDIMPPDTWCPYFHRKRYSFPLTFAGSVYAPFGGGYSEHFTTCGYHQLRRTEDNRTNASLLFDLPETSSDCVFNFFNGLSYCGPDVWRDTNPGYFQVSWYGGVGGRNDRITKYERPGEYMCWKGYRCEGRHHFPWPCLPGTYSNKDGTACIKCPAGWPCPMARTSENQLVVACWPGHYCPEGSASPTAKPCPPGTVNHSTAAEDVTACKTCPAGWICSERAFQAVGFEACPAGHYCGEGALEGTPCPAGTHAPFSGASNTMKSQEDCIPCVAGYYCPEGSDLLQMLSRPCPPGRVCPPGTSGENVPKCLPGFYSNVVGLTSERECIPCPAGHYCDYGDNENAPDRVSGVCSEGLMSLNTGKFGDAHSIRPIEPKAGMGAQCVVCDPGYKCAGGLRTPCGRGYFSEGGSACTKCEAGHYCPDEVTTREQMEQQKCPAGTFCKEGVDSVPWVSSHPCPKGSYCPEGTVAPVGCPVGKVNPKSGQADLSACTPVPAGYYVSSPGWAEPEGLCKLGHYCPEGSTSGQMNPCPLGTFARQTGAKSEEDCDKCPQGYYCNGQTPILCEEGHYCPLGSVEPQECPPGTLSTTTGNTSINECIACPPGYYCEEGGTTITFNHDGVCFGRIVNARYMCYGGAVTPTPTDGVTGERCSPGGYCKAGATTKSYCEAGKYNPNEGASSAKDCINCPEGYVCSGSHSPEPDGKCSPGAYCTGGAFSSRQHVAAKGHYAPEGSSMQYPCKAGSFGPHEGLAECYLCPPGWITIEEGQTKCRYCFEGQYCPEAGITDGIDCPAGTYRDKGHAASIAGCHHCPPFKACTQPRLETQTFSNCKAGYYCIYGSSSTQPEISSNNYNINKAGPCPPGFYCEGNKPPAPCPRGTLGLADKQTSASDCLECTAGRECTALGGLQSASCPEGFFCPVRTINARRKANFCHKGQKCPAGSDSGKDCEKGTFAPFKGMSQCINCPAGYVCDDPNIDFETQNCPKGFFCPTAAANATPCPIGTVGLATNLSNKSLCLICPPGHYCSSTTRDGSTDIHECPEGTYSNPGAKSGDECVECPAGSFCPHSTSTPIPCLAGMLCAETGLHAAKGQCPAGKFCKLGDNDKIQEQVCRSGAYCPEGSPGPLLCPIGKYSSTSEAVNDASCIECPAGRYCGAPGVNVPEGTCAQGYYCPQGSFVPEPQEYVCPKGHMCPGQSAQPTPCDAALNKYQPRRGQAVCESCPAGFRCDSTGVEPCPAGQYCPPGAERQGCRKGTFNPLTGMQSAASCLSCSSGWACTEEGLSAPNTKCAGGHYCTSGATTAAPEEEWSEGGSFCTAGFICPEGSISPIPCPSGSYCPEDKSSSPAGQCSAGYYCAHHATENESTEQFYEDECPSNIKQGVCPPGAVCPEGSTFPLKCPAGTVQSSSGGTSFDDCKPCPEGSFCELQGLKELPAGHCVIGRHCKERSRTKFGIPCPRGHFCNEHSPTPQECPDRSYQPSIGAVTCEVCPAAGFLCEGTAVEEPTECPPGHICVDGEKASCPAGTYSNISGVSEEAACAPCPHGKACESVAATNHQTAVECRGGYYCRLGAPSPTPEVKACADDGKTACLPGARCPVGYYCPAGSTTPTACPAGTVGISEGADSAAQCSDCPANMFCPPGGGQWPCHAGFVCSGRASVPRPTDGTGRMCLEGHECKAGEGETPCPKGTYADVQGLGECKPCPAGFACPVGSVCPEGSHEPEKCPAGTFSKVEGLHDRSQCTICSPGKYCGEAGLAKPNGDCKAGYYCQAGARIPNYEDQAWPAGSGKCPPGHYCPEGSAAPTRCPPGSFNAGWGGDNTSDCQPCTAGKFCGKWGLVQPEGDCKAGKPNASFYCKSGSSTSTPFQEAAGDLCPPGHFCEEGDQIPLILCPSRSAMLSGAAECLHCPKGYVCTQGTTKPVICPAGYYCEEGQEPKLCPGGAKSNFSGLSEEGQCIECGSGEACDGTQSLGSCKAGYLCLAGVGPSLTPPLWQNQYTASGVQIGGPCPIGHFCPEGAKTPTACSRGTSTVGEGGVAAGDCVVCNAGWYCSLNSPGVLECPAGSYCPKGSIEPIECPAGTYSLSPMATDKTFCLECPAGYVCMPGTVDYLQWPCPLGYYCPKGSGIAFPCEQGTYGVISKATSPEECQKCPPGTLHFRTFLPHWYICTGAESPPAPCPAGRLCSNDSTGDVLCPAGSYCPGGAEEPLSCPQSYYCPEGSSSPGVCPDGSVCQVGVEAPILCPAGTYKGYFSECVNAPSTSSCCQMCPPGTFASSPGSSACEPCPAGYLCYGGTATHSPQLRVVDKGEPCPVGHYCPPGSSAPEPCPAGTYNDKEAGGNLLEACKPCEPDTYSDSAGQSGCYACGPTSSAEAGAKTCSCLGRHRWFQGIQGSCVCEGGYESYGPTGNSLSNVDSVLDCQPIVRDNCSGSQLAQLVTSSPKLRDSEGYCVDPSTCEQNCINKRGGFVLLAGRCMCLPLRGADVACDAECKRTLVKAYYQDGALNFRSDKSGSVGKLQVADLAANGRALGSIECRPNTWTNCAVHFYTTTKNGVLGLFGTPESLQEEAKLRLASLGAASSEVTQARRLAAFEGTPAVDNPVQCLQLYDTVAWKLEEDTYPVFLKDSLLNSNVAIDLSVFAELESAFQSPRDEKGGIKQTRSLEYFLYTFRVEGVFVFGTSASRTPQAIFSVLPAGVHCPPGTRYPGVGTPSSFARLGVQIYSAGNVEPDLTIVLLTLGCVLFVLIALLVSISVARKLQYRKRQAVDQKGDGRKHAKVFGGRSAAIKAKRRLEALLADIIEQRLMRVHTEKVLALEPTQLEDMLSQIPIAVAEPQSFELAFGALHQLSVKLNTFFSKGGSQYRRHTRDLAIEISQMQKNALKMLELIKERLQQRGRLSEQMGPMLEGVNQLLGELRSADLFINAVASSTKTSDSDGGHQAALLRMLASCTNIGVLDKLHLRLLHAAVDGMRYTALDADRVYVLTGIKRLFSAPSAQEHLPDGTDDVVLEGSKSLIKEASQLLNDGCELLSSFCTSKQSMKAQLLESRKRENEALRAACTQFSATFGAAVATALQGLVEQEDQILQLHLSRLTALASAAKKESGGNPANLERVTKALQAHSNESKAQFKKVLKDCSTTLKQSLKDLVKREKDDSETLERQREVQVSALLEQRVREADDCIEEIHRFERQLVLAAIQLSIHVSTVMEEKSFQATLQAWTNAVKSALRTEALNLRRQARHNDIEESEYRRRKASLASSLASNIQRLTREHFNYKATRIADFEREAMRVYEQLMEAIHKRQKLEKILRREQINALVRLVRRKQRHAWSGAALEKKLLHSSVEESWSRMFANQERVFEFEVELQETLAASQVKSLFNRSVTVQMEQAFKDAKQRAEVTFEGLLEVTRELQAKRLKENLAEMAHLHREQEKEIEEALEEQKETLVSHREKWLQALVHEANLHTEAQGKLQALGESHALAAATSCLEAASQSLYHDAMAEEKDRAELESLVLDEDDEQDKLFQQRVADSLSLLKSTMDEEFQRRVDMLQSSLQQHQAACEQARSIIMEAHRQLFEQQTTNDAFDNEAGLIAEQSDAQWRTNVGRGKEQFAFCLFYSDWEEDFLSWQSGQLSERFEATTLDDSRLKQPRSADWEACCHSSGAKALDAIQLADLYALDDTPLPGLQQLGPTGEIMSRTRALMGNISAAQKSIVIGEAEWLEKCRSIQGGSQLAAAQDSKRKRAQNIRLQHMRESFRSKAVELRNEYDGEINALLEEEKQAETRLNRSQQAEEANLDMMFRIKEASIDCPEELDELRAQRQQAIAELLKDFQAQRDNQKAELQQRLDNTKAVLRKKQKQLCQQFEEGKQEACKEFSDSSSSVQEQGQNAKKAKLVEAARLNPSASNIYALHKELKDQHRDNLNSLVVKQMQDRAKFRHKVAMEVRAPQSMEIDPAAERATEDNALYGTGENRAKSGLTRQQTRESYQEKIRQLQEAAQDAAMQDEALGLQEEHLDVVIDTLNEFASTRDSPAGGLIEQAMQEKARLAKERQDLRRFVSERLLEAEKLARERKQKEEKLQLQESLAAQRQRKSSAKKDEETTQKQASGHESTRLQEKQLDEARKLRQFVVAMRSEGETLDELRKNSEHRFEKVRRAIDRERQRQKESLVSKLNARNARQAKLVKIKEKEALTKGDSKVFDAQGLLKTIAAKCASINSEQNAKLAEERDFKRFLWKMDVKAFAEERLQKLGDALLQFLGKIEKATNPTASEEASTNANTEDLKRTILQVTVLLESLDVAYVASRP